MLGAAAHGLVRPEDVVWEPSRGPFLEMLFGRRILFLARTGEHGERDVCRARVRLTTEGQPIEALGLRNITETPLGDDSGIESNGNTVVFATSAFGRVQGVSLLDLDGVPPAERPGSAFGRALLSLSSFHRQGSLSGLGRTDLAFVNPARAAKIALAPPRLSVDTEDPDASFAIDVATGELAGPKTAGAPAVRVVRGDYRGRSSASWFVDVVRSYVGQRPVAWIEDVVFGARDDLKRLGSKLFVWSATARPKDPGKEVEPAHVLSPADLSGDETGFPPPPIPSLWQAPKPDEGKWVAVSYPWLPSLKGPSLKGPADKAPPYFYTTMIRPDPDRPYTEVMLVAMDMRQLELGMEGGYEEPEPATGPPDTGRIPRDAAVLPRVVAAFNGAFKAEHGGYGMMVGKRVLLPAVPGAATVAVMNDGAAAFGNWPNTKSIPDDIVSFRQNLDPLVEDGTVNPAGRHIWGFQIEGESTETERTAICLTRGRHVYYAWGHDISGSRLAAALRQAGCDYAIHLDMNPRHCGFVFMNAPNQDLHGAHYAIADSRMDVNPSRYVLGSDKDFFYVMLRNPAFVDPSGASFSPSEGTQPAPAFLPGIHEADVVVGDLELKVYEFDEGRVEWVLRAGADEPNERNAPSKKIGLAPALEGKVLASVGLGNTTDALRYGLAFDGKPSLDLRQSYATVVLSKGQSLRIFAPGERPELGPTDDAVQLPLLADHGQLNSRAADRGGSRLRGALCVTSEGKVFVALGHHDSSDPLASVLLESGCPRVVALDRGSRHPAFVHRSETATPPLSRYETSVLYAVGRPMTPHAYRSRFDGAGLTPPSAP